MNYTLTSYLNGKKLDIQCKDTRLTTLLSIGIGALQRDADEYEITDEKGRIVAYAFTEDSPKANE